jgi:hypothetical protein
MPNTTTARQIVELLSAAEPNRLVTITFPIEAGAWIRREFRVWLDQVEASGITVTRWEQKGFLSSDFTVKLYGRSDKVARALTTLANWLDTGKEVTI